MCGPVGTGMSYRAAMLLINPVGLQTAEAVAITTDKLSCADNSRNVNTVHRLRYDMVRPESQENAAQDTDKHLC